MISKNHIADVKKLHLKKFRDQQGLFLVEGVKSVEMLLRSCFKVTEIFATQDMYDQHADMLLGKNVTIVTLSEMEKISTMATTPELLAVACQHQSTEPILDNQQILVLDGIRDPGNMGTIIRTADWFNIRHIICSPDCVELYNPKTIQATMGSFCHLNLVYTDLTEFLSAQKGRRILGTFLGGTSIHDVRFKNNDIIVMGSESNGITPEVAKLITEKVTIPVVNPGRETAESLNAAIATAIMLYAAHTGQ